MEEINCFKCKNLIISWDNNAPYGCKLFSFKSKQMPAVVVKNSSGQDCKFFDPKEKDKQIDNTQ